MPEHQSLKDITICHGHVIPRWLAKKIRSLRWSAPPDEIRFCGSTMLYRHGENWSWATFRKTGRHVMGLASYLSFEHAKDAAGA